MKLLEGWKEVELGEVGQIITGSTPPKINPEYYGDSIPWIKPPDLDNGMYVSNSKEKISEKGRSKVRILPEGSVIVSCIGIIGKVAIAKCEICTNQQINSIIPNKEIADSKFLYYLIKKIKPVLEKRASSAVVPLLNKSEFSKFKIILPPLETQKQIVSLLEKAEKVKEWRKEVDNLTKDFLKSVFFEMFLKDKDKLGNLEVEKGIIKTEMKNPLKDFPEKYFEYVDISSIDNQLKKIVETKKVLGKDAPSRARQLIKSKDVIISTVRPNLNSVAFVNEDLNDGVCSTGFCILRADNKNFIPEYLFFISQEQFFINDLVNKCKGANYPAISNKDIKCMEIPLPPIELQNKFASIVKEVEAMKEQQKHSRDQIDNLFNALMQKAFKGELINGS